MVGFRRFIVGYEGYLGSVTGEYRWKPEGERASCNRLPWVIPDHGGVPFRGCSCGYYILTTIPNSDQLLTADPFFPEYFVSAAVIFWGEVVVVRDYKTNQINGVKAEYARPIALLEPGDKEITEKWWGLSGSIMRGSLRRCAKRYKIPIMERDLMLEVVREFGDTTWVND
jgi:hypothetical protein